ncbi:MAG: hypothetical protein EOP33_04885 [Rickettsiaceae bacterium]|nr:MAG: hypothetical protein EOP33_04885 [Rickettsiaceae bacterium]
MKKLIFVLSLLAMPVIIYTMLWYICLYSITNKINSQYSNKYINQEYLAKEDNKYLIRFKKITPTGFPFKIAFKVIGWTEDNKVGKTEYLNNVYLGYNLLQQNFFLKYSGEALAWYKPLESKFGSKITVNDYIYSAKVPTSIKNIKQFIAQNRANNSNDLFQIINFIEKLSISSGKMQVKDLVNSELLYEQEHKIIEMLFDKRIYYKNIEDFFSNVPHEIEIWQKAKVNKVVLNRLVMPPSILFSVDLPVKFDGENKILIKLNQPRFEDILRDCEVHYQAIRSDSSLHKGEAEIHYVGKIAEDRKNINISLKIDANFLLKKGFFDSAFYSLKHLTDLSNSKDMSNILKEQKFVNMILGNYLSNLNNSTLRKLENRDYNLKLDLALLKNDEEINLALNHASIFSDKTGINFKGVTDNRDAYLKGVLSFHNYQVIANLLLIDDLFGLLRNFSSPARHVYFTTAIEFLRSISDHPTSNANNISFEYFINHNKLSESKIGNIELANLMTIFNHTLYRKATEETNNSSNRSDEFLMELLPTLKLQDIERIQKERHLYD